MRKKKLPLPPGRNIPFPPVRARDPVNKIHNEVSKKIPRPETGKLPPQAIDLEKAVIGAILLDSKSIKEVIDLLSPEVFYIDQHKFIYKAIQTLSNDNSPIDILTVTQELIKTNKIDYVGGTHYLIEITQNVSSSAHIEFHARIVIQKYVMREYIRISNEVIQKSYEIDSDIFDIKDMIELRVSEIVSRYMSRGSNESKEDPGQELLEKMKARERGEKPGTAIGLESFDDWSGGLQLRELITIAGRPGMGKGLVLSELVKTPRGNKKISDLVVGDEICNSYGSVSNITGVFPQGKRPVYEITFDDGLKVKADDQHLWEVQDRKIRKKGSKEIRVISTSQLIKEGLYVNKTKRKNFSIRYAEPVNHSKKQLLIDPYILGCLIGDGYLSEQGITFSNPEDDILSKFENYFGDNFVNKGIESRIRKCEVNDELKHYGLIGKLSYDKFIPNNYLYSSIEDRLKILQGLLDTDGNVVTGNENHIEYSTTSEKLKNNIMTLVRGLGGRCSFTEKMGKYKKDNIHTETRINYRIWITFPCDIIPVSSKKHLLKYINKKQFHKRFINKIEYVGEEETVCISVDSKDKCFLMNDYLVTHNTTVAIAIAYHIAFVLLKDVMFFSIEMSKTDLYNRFASRMTGIPFQLIRLGKTSIQEYKIVDNAFKFLDKSKLHVFDMVDKINFFDKLVIKIREYAISHNCKIVFIDYVQLIKLQRSSGDKTADLTDITRDLKSLANELGITIVILAQLNRGVDNRVSKVPNLADLKQSGSIEEDSDTVIFPYRPHYYEEKESTNTLPQKELNKTRFIVAKGRSIGTGEFMANLDFMKFTLEDFNLFSN